jgi:hypothetical protein
VINRENLDELHYITPIANVPSILVRGILSNKNAAKISHATVAAQEIQDRRKDKPVPGTTYTIHDYANLYFHARNPMMFKRRPYHEQICVLRVKHDVLDLPRVVITDQNAASGYVRFYPSPAGLEFLDGERIFARSWQDEDQIEYFRRKSAKCAEVLVPGRVDASFVFGAYVSGTVGNRALATLAGHLPITEAPDLFFQV